MAWKIKVPKQIMEKLAAILQGHFLDTVYIYGVGDFAAFLHHMHCQRLYQGNVQGHTLGFGFLFIAITGLTSYSFVTGAESNSILQ